MILPVYENISNLSIVECDSLCPSYFYPKKKFVLESKKTATFESLSRTRLTGAALLLITSKIPLNHLRKHDAKGEIITSNYLCFIHVTHKLIGFLINNWCVANE